MKVVRDVDIDFRPFEKPVITERIAYFDMHPLKWRWSCAQGTTPTSSSMSTAIPVCTSAPSE